MAFKHQNRYSIKLNTPELIREAFESYCAHIASGKPKEAWYFEKDGKALCIYRTIEKYIEESEDDFTSIQISIAEAKRYEHWFNNVSGSAIGTNEKANTASLQMIMRNMFGWDKKEETQDIKEKEDAIAAIRSLASAMTQSSPKEST